MNPVKKKLLLVITKSNFGGAQRYVYDIATSLKDSYDVVVAFGGQGALAQKLTDAGIATRTIPSLTRDVNPFLDISTFFNLIKLFRIERPHIVHLNSSKIGALGSLAARIARVPRIIFTTHGWAFNESRGWFARKIIATLQWFTVLFSHHTIAVAEQELKDVADWNMVKTKIACIHNGIAPIDFLNEFDARTKLKLPPGLIIGTISELHTNKGLENAIRAFAGFHTHHPESHFVIIGEGEQRTYLTTLIQQLNLTTHVHLIGFVPDAARYLKALNIFTLTSYKEGFPYAILEAGAAGRAVIASHVGGIPEIITNDISGILIDPYHSAQIQQAMTVLAAPSIAERCGTSLQNHVIKTFSLKEMLEKTVTLYELS